MDVSLDSKVLDQLNTAEAKALHSISDRLSACGVGKIVNLPQIIVVGEQSSGKSSVLEAISHVHFPVEGGLCTRFATEVVLRHATETRVDVSVKFADSSKSAKSFQRTGFRQDDLPDIIKEAKECMGFTRAGKDFSKDVLRLEIEGPGMYPLTLVDLPGLFHADTETQSLGGKETVDELVESYMRQENSIILVVITANNQLASHVALRKVKQFDPNRERTIGVITKPDLTRPGYTDERTYIRVALNEEGANKLRLGWHVLRNRAEDESSLDVRDQVEERFFERGAWASIPPQDRGIASLRKKLSTVLYNHIRTSLPGVVLAIEGKLRDKQEALGRLGKPRASVQDMRSFLLTIAGDFQRLARDGVYGRYNDPFFGNIDDEDRKLRAQLRNFNRVFDHVLSTKGSKQGIIFDQAQPPSQQQLPPYLEGFIEKYPYDFPDPQQISVEALDAQLQRQAAANQGREFPGNPNNDLAIRLFQDQATPWKRIAEFHIDQVIVVAKAFVDELFGHVVGPLTTNPTTEAILSTCVDPFFAKKEILLREKLDELLRPYTEGYAVPLDIEFHQNLSARSTNRLKDTIINSELENQISLASKSSNPKLIRHLISQAITTEQNSRQEEFGTDKVINMMLTYYEMSRRTFIDNVINLAVESCLIRDIPDILTPTKIDCMTEERLSELAAESQDSQSRRLYLEKDIEILREGLHQCQKYKPRKITALPVRARSPPPVVNLGPGSTTKPEGRVVDSIFQTKSALGAQGSSNLAKTSVSRGSDSTLPSTACIVNGNSNSNSTLPSAPATTANPFKLSATSAEPKDSFLHNAASSGTTVTSTVPPAPKTTTSIFGTASTSSPAPKPSSEPFGNHSGNVTSKPSTGKLFESPSTKSSGSGLFSIPPGNTTAAPSTASIFSGARTSTPSPSLFGSAPAATIANTDQSFIFGKSSNPAPAGSSLFSTPGTFTVGQKSTDSVGNSPPPPSGKPFHPVDSPSTTVS
ncbi:hypothetical protein S7711_02969 [Stachybotrys chartarum IBT 7711]|uniref:Dynamin-type G domain-containing protein n=1 Tax=Stachybotrys chartarum (strain CBS 109288 / IBT 7711) TaxID=1280523 RepID=A0A084B2G4_STACB|nr:hypothetical protein S7711_02969 [Stachybotrys chartarum IBT 7711]